MKKSVCILVAIIATTTALADVKPVVPSKKISMLNSRERERELRMKWYGGDIVDRRLQKGSFCVINTQEAVGKEQLNTALTLITEELRIEPIIENGAFDIMAPAVKGEATLFVVDNAKFPMSLVAIEAKWALVNISKLKSDKPPFFEARVKKEIYRTVGQLFGAFSNQYESNIFSGVFSAEDLDQIVSPVMPLEYRMRYRKYISQMGITPYALVHYKKAVQEGWAPAPTNEYQKAIWDKVHAIPKNPMKIEFDPKKGR